MSTLRLCALLCASLVLVAACGAERPELETVDRQTDVDDGSRTTQVIVVEDVAQEDTAHREASLEAATGRSARAIAPEPESDPANGSDLPPLVILDTDMGPDIDDALALAMLHTYMDREQAEIAAVTLSRNSVLGARYIDALNTWYGHPDIPVGIDRQAPHTMNESSSYVALASRFANDVADQSVPEGVTVLREVLVRAIAEERQVIIVQVGFSGNVAALLDSRPDDRSILNGVELVERSGAVLSIMAGSFKDRVEFNVANDVESARRVIEGWPNEMILSPFEIGYDLHYPYTAIRDRHNGNDLLRQSYEFTDYSWHVDAPSYYNMRTWDLTSVMEGVDPEAGWFPLSGYGRVTIDGQGRTFFSEGSGQHRVLVRADLTGQQLDAARSAMVELVSASTPQG